MPLFRRQENATLRAAALRRDAQLNAAEADAASKVEELSALREQLEKLRAASRLKEGSVEQVASLEQQVRGSCDEDLRNIG